MRLPLELIVVFLIADLYANRAQDLSSMPKGAALWSFAAMAVLFAFPETAGRTLEEISPEAALDEA